MTLSNAAALAIVDHLGAEGTGTPATVRDLVWATPAPEAVIRYIRTRQGKDVHADRILSEVGLILAGVRDVRIPDDAIDLIDAL